MTRAQHVAHLTSAHLPFDVRVFHRECRTLAEAGFDTALIVPHSHDEVVEGIRLRPAYKANGRKERMTRTIWSVLRAALKENADIYHFHDPELIPVGLYLKLKGKKVIYDVHEDLPRQVLNKHWISPWIRSLVASASELTEHTAARFLDGIVAVTPTIAERFPAKRTVLVRNFPELGELLIHDACPYGQRPATIAYVGNMSVIRGAEQMLEAISYLAESTQARLLIAGNFAPRTLEGALQALPGWHYVDSRGWQSREEVARLLGGARVGWVLLHPTPSYLESYPIKLFEYMAAGIPVVASDFPLWRDLIGSSRCALFVDPLDPRAIASATEWLLTHPDEAEAMGKRGQAAVKEKYNWAAEAKNLLRLYDLVRS